MTSAQPSEPKTPQRRFWPWVPCALCVGLLAAGGAWIVLQAFIGGMAEKRLGDYAARYGIHGLTLKVRHVTPWHADIQALGVGGAAAHKRLQVDHLSVDYSPSSLRARQIEAIAMSGLYLPIENTDGGWTLTGLPPQRPRSEEAADIQTPPRIRPGWGVKRLEIRNSHLVIQREGQDLRVPFELKALTTGETQDHYRGHLIIHFGNPIVRTAFDVNLARQRLTLEGQAEKLDLQHLWQALTPQPNLELKGRLAVTYKARLGMNPLSLETAAIEMRLPGRIALGPTATLQALDPHTPLATITRTPDRAWTLNAPGMAFTEPDRLHLTDWQGRLTTADHRWRFDGQFNLALQPQHAAAADGSGVPIANRLPITYRGEWMPDGPWSLALKGESPRWALDLNPDGGAGGKPRGFRFAPRLNLRISGQERHLQIEGTARLSNLEGSPAGMATRIPTVVLEATGEGPWGHLSGRYDLKADNLRLSRPPFEARIPRLAIAGTFATRNQGLQLAGQTRVSRATGHLPEHQLRLEGLSLQAPFSWPYGPSTASGTFSVAETTWKEIALGAVHGTLRQQAQGAEVHIAHESLVLPGGILKIDGRLNLDPANDAPRMAFDYRFTRPARPDDIDLGQLMTELTGIQFNGRIEAEGRGTYRAGQMTAGLTVNLAGAHLELPGQKGGLRGLRGTLAFPDLLAMRSAPRQQFFFERAYSGDIAATDGRFAFQIEPGGVFFLEHSQFKWCHGTVYLPATRIAPGKDDYDITLWCDRLKLAPLLEQLGAAQVEGGGTVSGRIPVRFRKGQILVDNGFLYSSPGEGGTIRLHGTEMLTAGMSPGTPEYAQLELARQALKEYDYRWVKLSLATAPDEDLLRLKLQLDGKPSRPLPFIYDPQAGGFVPAGPDSKGSTFQGISLDVNFSLPLNRLLEYKDLLKLFSQ